MTKFVGRYLHSRSMVRAVLSTYAKEFNFPLEDAISIVHNKIMGYSCAIEAHLRRIEDKKLLFIYRFKFISRLISFKYFNNAQISEFNYLGRAHKLTTNFDKTLRYDLYVCSLINYLPAILEKYKKSNSPSVLLVADDIFGSSLLNGIKNVYPISTIIPDLEIFENNVNYYRIRISKMCNKVNSQNYSYLGVNYGGVSSIPINKYLRCNLPHIFEFAEVVKSFYANINVANLYVARARRSTENIFLSFAPSGINRVMIVHGMLSSNYDHSHLYTTNYHNIDLALIWGDQQQYAIKLKQTKLNMRCPNFSYLDRNPLPNFNKANLIKKVLFIGQKGNDSIVYNLARNLAKSNLKNTIVIFRPHPHNFGTFIPTPNLTVYEDQINQYIYESDIVISHSSTLLLECMRNGAIPLILDFKIFNDIFDSIYATNNPYIKSIIPIVCRNSTELESKLKNLLSQNHYDSEIKAAAVKLYTWFVKSL